MKEKVYVDRLFADYGDTPEINDFKEEVTVNLAERVRGLITDGFDDEKAFEIATAELGNITAIADEVGKKKRAEAFGQMYMKARAPITKKTAIGMTVASGLLMLAAGAALIGFFSDSNNSAIYYISVVILSCACGAFAFFGLTQETAAHYAMKKARAFAYGAVCLAAVLGAGLAVVSFLFDGFEMSVSVAVKTAFILPAICGLIFLLATEPKRQKPWLKAMIERDVEASMNYHRDIVNPVKAARYGAMSGGLWLLSIAVFITLGLTIRWGNAWLVFPYTLAIQVFMTAMIFERKK